jgi:hypothetical protein
MVYNNKSDFKWLWLVLGTLSDRAEEEPWVQDREGKNRQGDHPDVVSSCIVAAWKLLDLHSVENEKLVFLLHQGVAPSAGHFGDTGFFC